MGYEFSTSGCGVNWTQETNKFLSFHYKWEFVVLWELGRDRSMLERTSGSDTVYVELEWWKCGELHDVFSGREHARGRVWRWRFESLFDAKWTEDERLERRASRYGEGGGDVYEQ